MYITVRRSSPRRHHHRGGDRQSLRGCIRFRSRPWWRFAICRRHVCCTAYLQPLAHRRRLDVPFTGRVSPLALSSRQSSRFPNIAPCTCSLATRQSPKPKGGDSSVKNIDVTNPKTSFMFILISILSRLPLCK